jgi:RNA polymerase sigma-70 factor (ECF subfamily)
MSQSMTEQQFHRWVSDHRGGWVRLAHKALRDRHEAEDVVQDTLTAIWQKKSRADIEDLDAYMARAVWWNALKKAKRNRRQMPLEGLDPAAPEPDVAGDDWDPLELEKAMEDLPEAQKAVVRLKYYGGQTFKEIGETLAISMNTAGSRCRYALEALREALGPNRRGT